MSNLIPYAVARFNVYLGTELVDGNASKVTLPDIEDIMETVTGAGLLGEVEVTTPGNLAKFEAEFEFQTIGKGLAKLRQSSNQPIILRAAGAFLNRETHAQENSTIKITLKGPRTTLSLGDIESNKPTQSKVKMSPSYLKVEVNDEIIVEIDKLNGIYKLNGEDQLSNINSLI